MLFKQMKTRDGTVIDYGLSLPEGFQRRISYPVLLSLPPGGQNKAMVLVGVKKWLADFKKSKWIVVSPVAPKGRLFFHGSEKYLPDFMDHILRLFSVQGNRFYLFGISNGGISVFRSVTLTPNRFHSATVIPGYPTRMDVVRLRQIKDIPVSMVVGDRDGSWLAKSKQTFKIFQNLGGNVKLEIVPGGDHSVFNKIDWARLEGIIRRK